MVVIPDRLRRNASQSVQRQEWLAALPVICERLSAAWSLDLGAAFDGCHISLVMAAERAASPAVLKVPMPAEIELETLPASARSGEADALRRWAGAGTVRLLEHDDATGAMLIERCVPGTTLDDLADAAEADRVALGLLEQLHHIPAATDNLVRLADRAASMAVDLPVRHERSALGVDQDLVGLAVDLLADLADTGPAPVLLHGDFHHHNIMAATREPWLAIDPLPMVGDPCYDVVQYLLFCKGDLDDPARDWGPQIARLCSDAGLDPERVRAWLFVRLITDAVAAHAADGEPVEALEARQGDLWSARLVHRLRG